ncbi:uncharacterized protein LOC141631285 [Silene latifolia]|uniref:uncharacterized protein LOC141631285 n=1 Tax=Silene latifolia TaxID=37657 RepID=UPI003D76C1EC
MEGFLKRIWSKHIIDKLSFLPNGVFIARFQSDAMKQAVLNSGYFLFDNKPVIIKPWMPDIELVKEEVKCVPAWVRLHKLPLKFWGKSLVKLANLVDKFIKSDEATMQKTRLGFARVMVELKIDQKFPDSIKFLDEKQQVIEIQIGYEWKPILCTKCKQLGHAKDTCRKGKKMIQTKPIRKEWRPVKKVEAPTVAQPASIQIEQQPATTEVHNNDQVVAEIIKTPAHRPGLSNDGSLSPVKNRQGISIASRVNSGSPTYMEALSGSKTPKQGIGVNETKIKPNNVNKAVSTVFNDWSVTTNSAYHVGGRIWVVWKPQYFDIIFLQYDAQFIHMEVEDRNSTLKFYYTIVYAFNGITEREPLWANIKRFRPPSTIPWVLGGNFNCVLLAEERLGGSFNLAEAEPFQQCLEDCEVMDLQASGSFYTWNNKQPPETRVYSRLDRALVNQGWTDHFPDMYANFLPEGHFDHSPCVIGQINRDHHRNRPFKYFNMWSMSPDFQACVDNIWKQNLAGTRMYRVTQKLRLLKPELKRINSTCYSDIENQAMLAATKLYQAQQHLIQQPGDRELMAQEYADIGNLFTCKAS